MAKESTGSFSRTPGGIAWPLDVSKIRRIGDSVTDKRPGSGRPHRGIDIFAEAGTPIVSAGGGKVSRVVDGRFASEEHRKRAGLYIDVLGSGGIIFRYLHLGSAYVSVGEEILRGKLIGDIAPAYTSGAQDPHLHFEMRLGMDRKYRDGYGMPLTPEKILPSRVA